MAYIHCHSCPWSQDDFWSVNGYNPFRPDLVKWLVDTLKDGVSGKQRLMEFDSGFIADHPGIDYTESSDYHYLVDFRNFLAMELRNKAKNIENMHWVTYDDYKNDPDKRCPKCGSHDLDID